MSNVQTVRDIYSAFGSGNIPAILEKLTEDVDRQYGSGSTDVPWLQPRKGRAAVAGFFEALGSLEFHNFVPKQILQGDGVVVSLVDVEFTVKATGKRVSEENEIHVWHFNSSGQVTRFKEGLDSHAHQRAYKP